MPAPAPQPAVLVLGDISVDVLARLENFRGLGEDHLVPALEAHCGGVGANVALALARWGVPVRLLGSTGRDWFGDLALSLLERAGIDVSFVERTERALTGLFFIAVSADGQRTMFGSRGANQWLNTTPAGDVLAGVRAVHLVGYNFLTPSVAQVAAQLIDAARESKQWVSLDVGMAPAHEVPELVLQAARKVSILFVNLEEAQALSGVADPVEAFSALEQRTGTEVVLKLGARGCLFREGEQVSEAPAFSIRAVDSTGAGDAFVAAFLRARLSGWPAPEAALLANAAGAAAASVLGAGEAMPEPGRILSVLEAHHLANRWEGVRIRAVERLKAERASASSDRS